MQRSCTLMIKLYNKSKPISPHSFHVERVSSPKVLSVQAHVDQLTERAAMDNVSRCDGIEIQDSCLRLRHAFTEIRSCYPVQMHKAKNT